MITKEDFEGILIMKFWQKHPV